MNQADRDKSIYCLAKDYLINLNLEGITPDLLEKYLSVISKPRPRTIAGIY